MKRASSAAVFFIQIVIVIIVAIDELRTNVINIVRRMTRTTTYSSERSSFDVVASLSGLSCQPNRGAQACCSYHIAGVAVSQRHSGDH